MSCEKEILTPNCPVPPVTEDTVVVEKVDWLQDPRDGQSYRIVYIIGKAWMAENLNFSTRNSWYYNNSPTYEIYGRLYNWEDARRACPEGWRLPEREEWEQLLALYGGEKEAFEDLILGGPSGLDLLFGGWRNTNSDFYGIGKNAYYWSNTEENNQNSWRYYLSAAYGEATVGARPKTHAYSCRCIKKSLSSR